MIRRRLSSVRRVLIPGLTGVVLGSLPGLGVLLWDSDRPATAIHSTDESASVAARSSAFGAFPDTGRAARALPAPFRGAATTAYRINPSLWEIPNG